MKKLSHLTCLLLMLVLAAACEAEDAPYLEPPVKGPIAPGDDYRDAFCGDFVFLSHYWETSMGQYYFSDTVTYWGVISKVDSSSERLRIRYRPGNPEHLCTAYVPWWTFVIPKVDSLGGFDYDEMVCGNHNSFSGAFVGIDSLHIEMGTGGNGSQYGHWVRGGRVR